MLLPDREKAYIPARKLVNYLLSTSHPVGKSKAGFFRTAGFNESNVELLELRLIGLARSAEVAEVEPTPHGTKYAVEGEIETPQGSPRRVRTVWIIAPGEERPRFVTAYPA